jgi:hypothetical protein
MKPLAIWLAIVAVVFGGYALVTTLLRDTERIFVFVDTSQPMEFLENEIVVELDRLDDRDHAEFALARGQSRGEQLVHSWQAELRWTSTPLFAPCSFGGVETFSEATDADERILITTAGSCDTAALTDWEIIELTP